MPDDRAGGRRTDGTAGRAATDHPNQAGRPGDHGSRTRPARAAGRRRATLDRPGQDVGHAGIAAGGHDQGDPLVPVEAGQGGHRSAFDLDDRDPQAGRVQDELLEGVPALGHDQQPACLAAGDERFLNRTAAGHDLVAGLDQSRLGGLQARAVEGRRAGEIRTTTIKRRPVRSIHEGAGRKRPVAVRPVTIGPLGTTAIWPLTIRTERSPAGRPKCPLERRPVRPAPIGRRLAGLEPGPIREATRSFEAGSFEARAFARLPHVGAILALGPAAEAEPGPLPALGRRSAVDHPGGDRAMGDRHGRHGAGRHGAGRRAAGRRAAGCIPGRRRAGGRRGD